METLNRLYYIHRIKRFLNKFNFRGKRFIINFLNFLMPNLKNNLIVKTQYKFKLMISPLYDKGIERRIFYNGIYEEGTLWCFEKILKKGDVVFDIGANIGLTTVYAAKCVGMKGKVYGFEPMPLTFKMLNFNVNLNKLRNVILLNKALSDRIGDAEMYDNIHINRGAASLYSSNKQDGIKISVSTLDNFINEFAINKIDFIKIDIEGAEIPMLKGANEIFKLKRKPIICLEYSIDVKSDYLVSSLYEMLKNEMNYELYKQLGGKESSTALIPINNIEDLPSHDNIYCFQEYHYCNLPQELFY